MTGYIYNLADVKTGEIIYIGSTIDPDSRLSQHKSGSINGTTPLCDYINKNNIQLTLDVIEELEVENSTELKLHERYWIHQFKAWGFNLRNSVFYRSNKPSPMINAYPIRLGDIKEPLEKYAKELGISLQRYILNILAAHVFKTTID